MLVEGSDLAKESDKIVSGLKENYGSVFIEESGDICNVLIDKMELEAYNKIKMITK